MENQDRSTRQRYTPEFKAKAIATASENRNVAKTARDLGVGYTLLMGWIKAAERATTSVVAVSTTSDVEGAVSALRRENALLREENGFLNMATAYFAKRCYGM